MDRNGQKSIYFECYGGISGDMTVAALLDMGADEDELKRQLATLPLSGYTVEISRVKKSGLDCCDFNVLLENRYENHDHDIEYLYGHRASHEHIYEGHDHEHHHDEHTHTHEHHHDEHIHEHRGLKDVLSIIEQSGITEGAKKIASDIFRVLASAEAKAHGETIESVHFHEVGAVDSIVDIVAAAVCFDNLGITDVIIPELYEGKGTVRCAHGILPVPVPAVMNIAREHGLKLHVTNIEAELVTPTGAAIAAAVRTGEKLPAHYKILASGMGAGKRDYGRPGVLRAMIIEDEDIVYETDSLDEEICKLESNIDDCTGEALGYTMECLFGAGARDVNYMPVFMKKNRPAYQVNIICEKKDIPVMEEILFRETTTIGIRRIPVERTTLRRKNRTVCTSLGEAQVKLCDVYGDIRVYPEYESVAAIAREEKLSYGEVWRQVQIEALQLLMGNNGK